MNRVLVIDLSSNHEFINAKYWISVFKELKATDSVIITADNADQLNYDAKCFIESILAIDSKFSIKANFEGASAENAEVTSSTHKKGFKKIFKMSGKKNTQANAEISIVDKKYLIKNNLTEELVKAGMTSSLYFIPQQDLVESFETGCQRAAKNLGSTRYTCFANFSPDLKKQLRASFGYLGIFFVLVRFEEEKISNESNESNKYFHISYNFNRNSISPLKFKYTKDEHFNDFFINFFNNVENKVDRDFLYRKSVIRVLVYNKTELNFFEIVFNEDGEPDCLLTPGEIKNIVRKLPKNVRVLNMSKFYLRMNTTERTFNQDVFEIIESIPATVERIIISGSDNKDRILRYQASNYLDKDEKQEDVFLHPDRIKERTHVFINPTADKPKADREDTLLKKNELLLEKENEIEKLRKIRDDLEQKQEELFIELAASKADLKELKGELKEAKFELSQAKNDLHASEDSAMRARNEYARLEENVKKLSESNASQIEGQSSSLWPNPR